MKPENIDFQESKDRATVGNQISQPWLLGVDFRLTSPLPPRNEGMLKSSFVLNVLIQPYRQPWLLRGQSTWSNISTTLWTSGGSYVTAIPVHLLSAFFTSFQLSFWPRTSLIFLRSEYMMILRTGHRHEGQNNWFLFLSVAEWWTQNPCLC